MHQVLINDVLLHADGFDVEMKLLEDVLERVWKNGWKLKKSKCTFMQEKVAVLGHVVSEEGVSKD